MLERFGLKPEALPSMGAPKEQRTLILDADGAAYRATAKAKTMPTAIKYFVQEVLEQMFLTGTQEARLHLTPSGSYKAGRDFYPTWKPYQANRSGKAKPPLLEPLRSLLSSNKAKEHGLPEDWVITGNRILEADDACVIDAYILKDKGVVVSDDKDLRMTRYPYWEAGKCKLSVIQDRFGYVEENPNGTYPYGHGTIYFWLQMLMGDTADNIRGLDKMNGQNVGKVAAFKFLHDKTDENAVANEILWHYAKIKQDALAEAQVLWMRRFEGDCAFTYLNELELDKPLKEWLYRLNDYHGEYKEQKCRNLLNSEN